MLNLTVRMHPLLALITRYPHLTIGLGVLSFAKVHLLAVVTLIICLIARVAIFTETDKFSGKMQLDSCEFGLLLDNSQGLEIDIFYVAVRRGLCQELGLVGVKGASKLVVTRLLERLLSLCLF